MATTFLDLIVVLLWPLVLSAAAWVIAINALAEKDEISKVVEALTRPNGVEENAKRGDVFSTPRQFASGDGGWFQGSFQTHAAHSPQHIKGERPSDEKNTFARG